MGLGGVMASAIVWIHEAKKDAASAIPEPKGIIPNLKRDWNAATGFAANRIQDLTSEDIRLDKGLANAFNNGCLEIAFAGPNKVSAKIWNALLYPWALESALRGDWDNVASACLYRTFNYFYAQSSKRMAEHTAAPV